MSSRLSHYLWRCFLIPHADESAVPQFATVGPPDEGDLANQLRLDPATLALQVQQIRRKKIGGRDEPLFCRS
jgi:hypothetical protein